MTPRLELCPRALAGTGCRPPAGCRAPRAQPVSLKPPSNNKDSAEVPGLAGSTRRPGRQPGRAGRAGAINTPACPDLRKLWSNKSHLPSPETREPAQQRGPWPRHSLPQQRGRAPKPAAEVGLEPRHIDPARGGGRAAPAGRSGAFSDSSTQSKTTLRCKPGDHSAGSCKLPEPPLGAGHVSPVPSARPARSSVTPELPLNRTLSPGAAGGGGGV